MSIERRHQTAKSNHFFPRTLHLRPAYIAVWRQHYPNLIKTAAWKAWWRNGTPPTPANRWMNSQSSPAGSPSQLPPGSAVLEVAPGPGYFSIELAKLGAYSITGLDISHTFVEIAAKKAAEAGVHVEFRQGNASSMPFARQLFRFSAVPRGLQELRATSARSAGNVPRAETRRPGLDHRSPEGCFDRIDQSRSGGHGAQPGQQSR